MNKISWDYYNKFKEINEKYFPDCGEGETEATQIVTAINKLVYKWYNDGDVFDNTYYLEGWANDLSSYANWLYTYVEDAADILDEIKIANEDNYEEILQKLADKYLTEEFLSKKNESKKRGSIYDCYGPYRFEEEPYEDDYYDEDYEEEEDW